MSLRTTCPHCAREAVLVAEALGKNVRCKGCSKPFTARPSAKGSDPEMRAAVKAGATTATQVRSRPQSSVDHDDDPPSRPGDREESKTTLWIGLSAIGAVTILASILVFVLIVNRHPQPQPFAHAPAVPPPPAKQAPAVEPAPAAKVPPKPVELPPKANPVAEGAPTPKVADNSSDPYGKQGDEAIAPAVPGPNVLMRCRADDSFYRLSDVQVLPAGANPRGTLIVHVRIEHRGELDATHLLVAFADGRKESMGLGGQIRADGEIKLVKDSNSPTPYPEAFECFLARVDSTFGPASGIFLVSDVARVGNIAERTRPRNWTPEEIARYAKKTAKLGDAPANLYGTQGNEPVAPATEMSHTLTRARSDDSFYRMIDLKVVPNGNNPRGAVKVRFKNEYRGKNSANHLIVRFSGDRTLNVGFVDNLSPQAATLTVNANPFGAMPYPEDIECFLVRVDSSYGAPPGMFLLSNAVQIGNVGEATRPRNWTPAEIARFTKEFSPGLRENLHPGVGVDTPFAGTSTGLIPRRFVDPKNPVLGLEYRVGSWAGEACIDGLRPVYSHDQAKFFPQSEVAKEGYAVSGAEVQVRNNVDAVKLHFRRIKADGSLDPNDAYEGDWFGAPNPTARRITLGDTGPRVLGIFTRSGAVVDGVALVLDDR